MDNKSSATTKDFIPAKPTAWFIKAAQAFVRAELAMSNRLYLQKEDLDVFAQLPPGCGVVLTSNHADETDPRVCLELSRLSGKRFIAMCNREAFDETFGLAGWVLQRLGLFSVKRGAHDHQSKTYATDIVKQGRDVLLIFPEGEIYYLNEQVQPFHTGAIDICLEAIVENRKRDPNWTAYIVPMVIKYHYPKPIEDTLERRIAKMEAEVPLISAGGTLAERLAAIQRALLQREELAHNLAIQPASEQGLTQEIKRAENALLSEIEQKHGDLPVSPQAPAIDRAWQLGSEIRKILETQSDQASRKALEQDIAALKEVAQMSSWRPRYYLDSSSPDRLAEAVLKIERELYRIKRPRQLDNRNVLVKISTPIDMGAHVSDYLEDAHSVRHKVTEALHEQIQALMDVLTSQHAKHVNKAVDL